MKWYYSLCKNDTKLAKITKYQFEMPLFFKIFIIFFLLQMNYLFDFVMLIEYRNRIKMKNTQINLSFQTPIWNLPSLGTVSDRSINLKSLSCAQKILNPVQNDGSF